MSDTRLSELERRWKETGSPDDEAAYLLERVRVGDLTQERLELAAILGDCAASVAAGVQAADRLTNDVMRAVVSHGRTAWVMALTAVAEQLLPLWSEAEPDDARPREALSAVDAWLSTPTQDNANRASNAGLGAKQAASGSDNQVARIAAFAAYTATRYVSDPLPSTDDARYWSGGLPACMESAPCLAAILKRMGPWLLGTPCWDVRDTEVCP